MSRKTVAFSVPAPLPREPAAPPAAGVVASDAWVSRREPPAADAPASATPHAILLDLAAERTLVEVWMLSLLVPFALGWFWFARGMTGRLSP